ncbi:MAG: ribosome maturation factor RimM [bacterium]
MTGYVNIGIVTAPHGVLGWVKVALLTDDPDRFSSLDAVYFEENDGTPRRLEIEGVKYQVERALLKFKGIGSPEQAVAVLKGRKLMIPESEVPPIEEEDVYYTYQIIGMKVVDDEGATIGILEEIYSTGSNDVYLVREPGGKTEYMVPALKSCIRKVDVAAKVMVIDRKWAV